MGKPRRPTPMQATHQDNSARPLSPHDNESNYGSELSFNGEDVGSNNGLRSRTFQDDSSDYCLDISSSDDPAQLGKADVDVEQLAPMYYCQPGSHAQALVQQRRRLFFHGLLTFLSLAAFNTRHYHLHEV